MRAESLWRQALDRTDQARESKALVPLSTELMDAPHLSPFVLRRLLSQTPKHNFLYPLQLLQNNQTLY